MTLDEKQVLAEMLGLHLYADTLLELRESPPDNFTSNSCSGCFLDAKGCTVSPRPLTPPAADVCGTRGIFVRWKPKP